MSLSVLLVDDNPYVLRLPGHILAGHGADAVRVVGAVVGGLGAVAQATRLRPDMFLVNLTLPEGPDLQPLPRLRRMLPHAILIALSLLGRPAEHGAASADGLGGQDAPGAGSAPNDPAARLARPARSCRLPRHRERREVGEHRREAWQGF